MNAATPGTAGMAGIAGLAGAARTPERCAPFDPAPVADLFGDAVRSVLGPGRTRTVVIAMSRDEHPKATVLVRPESSRAPALAVKVATSAGAAQAVLREAAALRWLEERDPGLVHGTVPRALLVQSSGDQAVLVATALPGVPLATLYHRWRHTASAKQVESDFTAAAAWLADLSRVPAEHDHPVDTAWSDRIRRRWPGDEAAERTARGVAACEERLGRAASDLAPGIAHGDFWCGNVLHHDGVVTGVVDWEHARHAADPVGDRVRFALAYALYLDRHTAPGRRVAGHPGLVAGPWGEPVRHVLRGRGWFPQLVARFVGDGLAATGRDRAAWRDALLVGLAEVAATSDHQEFAREHLELAREALTWLS